MEFGMSDKDRRQAKRERIARYNRINVYRAEEETNRIDAIRRKRFEKHMAISRECFGD